MNFVKIERERNGVGNQSFRDRTSNRIKAKRKHCVQKRIPTILIVYTALLFALRASHQNEIACFPETNTFSATFLCVFPFQPILNKLMVFMAIGLKGSKGEKLPLDWNYTLYNLTDRLFD